MKAERAYREHLPKAGADMIKGHEASDLAGKCRDSARKKDHRRGAKGYQWRKRSQNRG